MIAINLLSWRFGAFFIFGRTNAMKNIIILAIAFSLGGCTGLSKSIEAYNEKKAAEHQQHLNSLPTCASKETCDELMEVAQAWIADNAGSPITVSNSSLIQTGSSRWNPALTVKKIPVRNGIYRIEMTSQETLLECYECKRFYQYLANR